MHGSQQWALKAIAVTGSQDGYHRGPKPVLFAGRLTLHVPEGARTLAAVSHLQEPEDLAGARISLKLLACKGKSAIGIERQLRVLIETAQVFQSLSVDGRLVSYDLDLKRNLAHLAILDEPISLQFQHQMRLSAKPAADLLE